MLTPQFSRVVQSETLLLELFWCWFVFRETKRKSEGGRDEKKGRREGGEILIGCMCTRISGPIVKDAWWGVHAIQPFLLLQWTGKSFRFQTIMRSARSSCSALLPSQALVVDTEQPSGRSRQTRRSSRLHENSCMRLWRNELSQETSTVAHLVGY